MSRSEMCELMSSPSTVDLGDFLDMDDAIEDMMYFNLCEFESPPFDQMDLMAEEEDLYEYSQMAITSEERNTEEPNVSELLEGDREALATIEQIKQENIDDEDEKVDIYSHHSSTEESMSLGEAPNMKIRYTRQYLLERRSDPLSTMFPKCLDKFYQTGEVPLKESEKSIDYRSMDHILFYTSLPYRMRRSLKRLHEKKSF